MWNDDQPPLHARVLAGEPIEPYSGLDPAASAATESSWAAAVRYFPSLLRASLVTIVLSCLAMGLAVMLGVLIATGRVYGNRLARALAVDPPVLLMDEPTASLDAARRMELAALLQSLVSRDRTLIVATHDEEFARAAAKRVLRVTDGVVRETS